MKRREKCDLEVLLVPFVVETGLFGWPRKMPNVDMVKEIRPGSRLTTDHV